MLVVLFSFGRRSSFDKTHRPASGLGGGVAASQAPSAAALDSPVNKGRVQLGLGVDPALDQLSISNEWNVAVV